MNNYAEISNLPLIVSKFEPITSQEFSKADDLAKSEHPTVCTSSAGIQDMIFNVGSSIRWSCGDSQQASAEVPAPDYDNIGFFFHNHIQMSNQGYSAGFDSVPAMSNIHPPLEPSDMTLLPAYSNLAHDVSSFGSDSFNSTGLSESCYYKNSPRSLTDSQVHPSNVPNNESSSNYSGKRRFRTNFTEHQSMLLEDSFKDSHYPDHKTKKKMAQYLNIPEDRITVWFQNRRAKWRRKEHRNREKTKTDSFCSQPYGYNCFPSSSEEQPINNSQKFHSYAAPSQNSLEPFDLKRINFPLGYHQPMQSDHK